MWQWGYEGEEQERGGEAAMNELICRYLVEELENRHLNTVVGPDGREYGINVQVSLVPRER